MNATFALGICLLVVSVEVVYTGFTYGLSPAVAMLSCAFLGAACRTYLNEIGE